MDIFTQKKWRVVSRAWKTNKLILPSNPFCFDRYLWQSKLSTICVERSLYQPTMESCLMYVLSRRSWDIWRKCRVVYDISDLKMCTRLITWWKAGIAFTQREHNRMQGVCIKRALTTLWRLRQLRGTFTSQWSECTGPTIKLISEARQI